MIINGDIDNYQEIYDSLDCNVITYGSSDSLDYSASNITYDEKGLVAFDLIKNRKAVDHIQLSVTGDHNVSNALASIATAELLQIPMETIKKGILSFSGTDRRFEYKGTFNGVTVVDDYAHHPTEIAATLEGHDSTTHTIRYGVSSSPILIREQRLSSMNLQRLFLTRIIWFLQISMQLVRQILSEFLLPVLQRKHANLEQMHITFQVLNK